MPQQSDSALTNLTTAPCDERRLAIVAKTKTKSKENVEVDANSNNSLFGIQAETYWERIGPTPLLFTGFGLVALIFKLLKVQRGQWKSGPKGVNKAITPQSVITNEEEKKELHVFKCGGCGYEMYPARGREFKFFPDTFKCPLCKSPKSMFWDLNDPDDPRNQETEDDGEEPVGDEGGNGTGMSLRDADTPEEPAVSDSLNGKEPSE